MFAADITDAYLCQCSPGGCTLLAFLLKPLIPNYEFEPKRKRSKVMKDTADSENGTLHGTGLLEGRISDENPLLELIDGCITYIEQFSCHLQERHHYPALRYTTYTALEIRRSCCAAGYKGRAEEDNLDSTEDELEDDQGHKLALLEDLLNASEEDMTPILQDPNKGVHDLIYFRKRTWTGRMSEVVDHLEGNDLLDDERRGAEEFGVVWDKVGPEPPEPSGETGNPYLITMIEFWLYELRKIEEECQ
ncbi:hypothetical protein LZL87_008696 [Fusarium oxysporum]|nr:hypothetical protein LZL87_008696 [Fusarium oxysporum]